LKLLKPERFFWGLYDPTGLKELKRTKLITCIDDASRFCVHGQFFWQEQLVDLLHCLKSALLSRGKPTKLNTDHGSIYTSNNFAHICSDLDITLIHSEVAQPEGRGKQERYYRTIQARFYEEAQLAGLMTLRDLNEFFWAWLEEGYHKAEHKGIGMTTLERWQKEEHLIKRLSFEQIHAGMQLRARRTIDNKTALIKLDGRKYQASRDLSGLRLQVRWPFNDNSAVNVFRNSKFLERAELFVPQSDIDYSKRPDRRALKEEKPKVLDSSKQFRAALLAKFRGEEPPEDTSRFGVLTEREFIFVCEQSLEKSLGEVERAVLLKGYKKLFPMDAAFVENALQRAKAVKGGQMHIGFYVRCLEESKQKR
jgi:hypothetical protein